MKPEEIKIGETYNVRMHVSHYSKGIISCSTVIGYDKVDGIQCGEEYDICHDEISAFSPIIPENGIKNSEPAPKYDPCRLYREGDKVRYVKRNGRFCPGAHAFEKQLSLLGTVVKDEQRDYFVVVNFENDEDNYLIDPAYLELATPVEELGPYSERHNKAHAAWSIYGPFDLSAVNYFYGERYPYTSETAKHAAEAECARLNAEYRKEQE